CKALSVRRPGDAPIETGVDCQTGERTTPQVPNPSVVLLIADIERDASAVGRNPWVRISAGGHTQRLFVSLTVDPYECSFDSCNRVARNVDECAIACDAVTSRAGCLHDNVLDHRCGYPPHFELVSVKRNREERAGVRVHQVPRPHITRIAAAIEEDF